MQPILGMPTLIELPDIDDTVALCLTLGLSFIELNMNMPVYCPERLDEALTESVNRIAAFQSRAAMAEGNAEG